MLTALLVGFALLVGCVIGELLAQHAAVAAVDAAPVADPADDFEHDLLWAVDVILTWARGACRCQGCSSHQVSGEHDGFLDRDGDVVSVWKLRCVECGARRDVAASPEQSAMVSALLHYDRSLLVDGLFDLESSSEVIVSNDDLDDDGW